MRMHHYERKERMNMKAHIYTIEDEYMGIPLTIEGELIDYEDYEPPFIVIQDISFKDRPLEMWTLNERYIEHLRNRIFQEWCNEVRESITSNRRKEARSC
jgi:hypothetical protein